MTNLGICNTMDHRHPNDEQSMIQQLPTVGGVVVPTTTTTSTEEDDTNDDKDIILRLVFLRCEPIILELCHFIEKILEPTLSSTSTSSSARAAAAASLSSPLYENNPNNHTIPMVTILQKLSDLLEKLDQRLRSLVTTGTTSTTNQTSTTNASPHMILIKKAIWIMMDYFMLPIMKVLRIFGKEQYVWKQQKQQHVVSSQHTTERQQQILQSIVWKCIIRATTIVTLLVESCCCRSIFEFRSHPPPQQQQEQVTNIMQRKLLSYLHHCIIPLPNSLIIQQQWFQMDHHTTAMSSQLDHGDDCLCRILTTIQVIIHAITTTTTTTTTNDDDCHDSNATTVLHNTSIPIPYMIRIIDCCITLIEPPPSSASSRDNTNNNNNNNICSERISPPLQLVAVELVQSLLLLPLPPSTIYPNNKNNNKNNMLFHWRDVFPGIYTGVYRRVLHSIRQRGRSLNNTTGRSGHNNNNHSTTTTISYNITWQCLTILTNLIQICCPNQNNNDHDTTTTTTLSLSSTRNHSTTVVYQLQSLITGANHNNTSSSSKGTEPDTNETTMPGTSSSSSSSSSTSQEQFISRIQQSIPTTLSILFHSFGHVRSTTKIRQQMIQLCRVILMDTYQCWMKQEHRYIYVSSLELILVYMNDRDLTVANNAKIFFTEYMTMYLHNLNTENPLLDHSEYSLIMKSLIGPQILEWIERLPSYVQSGRDDELQVSIQNIIGYLQHLPKQFLRSALTSESIQQMIRRTFTTIFDVSFEISDPYQLGTVVLSFINHHGNTDDPTNRIRNTRTDPLTKRQYMSESMIELTKVVVQTYGSVIGPKHGTMLVDACIADFYRSCMDRNERGVSMIGRSQIQWVHDWIGTITFIQCILHGTFRTMTNGEMKDTTKSRSKYRTKFLVPLLQSILPIITGYPLWDLGNHWSAPKEIENSRSDDHFGISAFRGNVALMCALLEFIKEAIELLDSDTIQSFNSTLLYPILDKMSEQYPGAIRETAYHAMNALATINQHDGIVTFITQNIESCLIGPMLSRLRIPGGRSLQPDTPIDYEIICVLDCATTILRLATEAFTKGIIFESKSMHTPDILMSMEELTTQLTIRFDHASIIMTYDVATCLRYLQLYSSAIGLLQVVYQQPFKLHDTTSADCTKKNNASPSVSSPSPCIDLDSEPWFQVLAPYTKATGDDDELNAKEGFEKYWKEKDDMIRKSITVAHPEVITQGINHQRDVKFCSYIVWRLGYLMSHPNLQVQHRSCDVIAQCFQWLGFLSTSHLSYQTTTPNADDAAPSSNQTPKNAVLRQVHSLWPTISARMTALCTAVVTESDIVRNKQPLSLLVIKTVPASGSTQKRTKGVNLPFVGEQRIYLSKILQLVSVMVENTEDFMYSRFQKDIYPKCILKLLQYYLKRVSCNTSNTIRVPFDSTSSVSQPLQYPNQRQRQSRTVFTESDETLLYNVFDCLQRLYKNQQMGRQLCIAGVTPAIGQYVIAILFHGSINNNNTERIRNVGIDALRQMIAIDPDALYRPLFQFVSQQQRPSNWYSNRIVPSCPLLPVQPLPCTARVDGEEMTPIQSTILLVDATTKMKPEKENQSSVSVLTILMDELLDLIDTIPEQPIW